MHRYSSFEQVTGLARKQLLGTVGGGWSEPSQGTSLNLSALLNPSVDSSPVELHFFIALPTPRCQGTQTNPLESNGLDQNLGPAQG